MDFVKNLLMVYGNSDKRGKTLEKLLHVVAVALVDAAGKILIQRRPEGTQMAGLWEFPGGKIDSGETPDDALRRELVEELGVEIDIAELAPLTFASQTLADKHLLLMLYLCRSWKGEPRALHASEIEWVWPIDLYERDMPPADAPFIPILEKLV